jgi:hypothetical protein
MSWSTPRSALIRDLRRYAEDDLADRVAELDDADLKPIWDRVGAYFDAGATSSKAFVAATVEALEGAARPVSRLHRPRRREPLEFVQRVRERPDMFTSHNTYLEACSLVVGYDVGSPDDWLVDDFHEWLQERFGRGGLGFPAQVLRQAFPEVTNPNATTLSEAENAVALELLFDMLEQCLSEGA